MTTAVVRARIDETIKAEASEVLAQLGLTVSDLMRIALTKVAKEKAFPFDMSIPNHITIASIEKSERGEDLHQAQNSDDLFNQLGL